jgi:CheY-like chemotaxis protein
MSSRPAGIGRRQVGGDVEDGALDGVPIEIMLIEDDPGDVLLTREAFADYKVRNQLMVFADGGEAIRYLSGSGRYAGRRLPELILLDLNMPGVSGREVLTYVHGDPALRRIPVVVLTASHAEEDVLRSQLLGVDTYLRKPVDFGSLVAVVRRIEMFFLRVDRVAAGPG